MALSRCPGQDTRFWRPSDVTEEKCPRCGHVLEFWKDDIALCCRHCGERVFHPRYDPGCARWCAYAEQCLRDRARGGNTPPLSADGREFRT